MPRTGPTPPLHDLEREVMDVLWDVEAATVRQVLDAVNVRHRSRPRAYTTIMTTVHRLERKGLAVRDGSARSHVFRAAMDERTYAAGRADALVAELGDLALAAFADRVERLDASRREALRRLGSDG